MDLLESVVIMIICLPEGDIRFKPLHVVLKLAQIQPFFSKTSMLVNMKNKLRVVLGDEGWLALLGTHGMPFRLIRTCIVIEGLWDNSLQLDEIIH